MIKHQIHIKMPVSQCNPVLPADEGEALAQFEQKLLPFADQPFF